MRDVVVVSEFVGQPRASTYGASFVTGVSRNWAQAVPIFWVAAVVFLCSICLSSCSRRNDAASAVRRYQLRGQVVRMDPQAHAAVIKHQKIEGWMGAMTMEFPVKNEGEFQALHDGDRIRATVFVRDLDYWIGDIQHEMPHEK